MEGEGKPLLSNRRSTLEPDEWSNTSKGMSHSLNVVADGHRPRQPVNALNQCMSFPGGLADSDENMYQRIGGAGKNNCDLIPSITNAAVMPVRIWLVCILPLHCR